MFALHLYMWLQNETAQPNQAYTKESHMRYSAIGGSEFKPSVGERKPLEGLCLKARANLIVCLSASNLLRLTEIFP